MVSLRNYALYNLLFVALFIVFYFTFVVLMRIDFKFCNMYILDILCGSLEEKVLITNN
jgi:hypothetical protein